jgi:3-oxoacyl-[acyl-carrier protein] reductase
MDIRLMDEVLSSPAAAKGSAWRLAQRFAASGADVAILARSPDTLAEAKRQIQATAKGKVATVSADGLQSGRHPPGL